MRLANSMNNAPGHGGDAVRAATLARGQLPPKPHPAGRLCAVLQEWEAAPARVRSLADRNWMRQHFAAWPEQGRSDGMGGNREEQE